MLCGLELITTQQVKFNPSCSHYTFLDEIIFDIVLMLFTTQEYKYVQTTASQEKWKSEILILRARVCLKYINCDLGLAQSDFLRNNLLSKRPGVLVIEGKL